MRRFLAVLVAVACILGVGSVASARVIRVTNASSTNGPGDTWDHAYHTITEALAVAVSGDELWVRYGTFQEAVTIPSGVALYGGFVGTETTLSQREAFPRLPSSTHDTWLSGSHNNSRLVTIPNSAISSTRLDGFTVYGCNRGGVSIGSLSSPTITNCVIAGCDTPIGAGIYVGDGATPLITKNEISGNEGCEGGGIYVGKSAPIITSNLFQDNKATCGIAHGYGAGTGGAICLSWCRDLTPLIANNRMSSNEAYHKGGAIYCYDSSPIITGNVMQRNCAYDANYELYHAEQGGAIYSMESSPVINQNTFFWNGADHGGGAVCLDESSSATIYGNIIHGNRAGAGWGWNVYKKGTMGTVVSDYNNLLDDFETDGCDGYTLGAHDVVGNPGFVNDYYMTPDLALAPGSPCVDTGYPGAAGLQAVDALGNQRIIGPSVDKGGYEHYMQITALSNDTPASQTAASGLYWFQVKSAQWAAVGLAPQTSGDVQAAASVWMTGPYATSSYSGATRDFTVANGQSYGNTFHYAQVSANSGTSTVEAEWFPRSVGTDIPESGSFTATEVLDVFQASLLSGKTYQIVVHPTSGAANPALFVFKPSQTGGSRATAAWKSYSGGVGADEQVYAITTEAGTYGIVVVNEAAAAGTYNLSITERAPVTISGHLANFAGTSMGRVSVRATNGGGEATADLFGNYSLTVPYYWSGSVSPVRSGYAFTPSALARTNLTTGIVGADFTGGQVTSVGGTKALPDGRSVYLSNKAVTAVFGSDAYIEDLDRVAGIRVVGGATSWTSITLGGVLSTANGERRITLPVSVGPGPMTVAPVHLRNSSIGGAATTYAPGIPGTAGLNNVGLLVRTSGVVTGVSGGVFYIDDGSGLVDVPGTLGIRVDTGGLFSAPPVGKRVVVTGISGVWMNGSSPTRVLLPRSAADVQRVYRVALVHGASTARAAEIHNLAELNGIDTALVPDSQVASTSFAPFDAVLVSSDSLVHQSSQAIAKVTNSGLPVMGIGTGGSRYFDARGLYIGWSHGSTTTGPSTIVPRASSSSIFATPNDIYAPTITPYSGNVSAVLVYMPSAVMGVARLASPPDPAGSYYALCSQSRCLLWGYESGAHLLTPTGESLFINAIHYALGL